jgi:chromosome segregation ATPase
MVLQRLTVSLMLAITAVSAAHGQTARSGSGPSAQIQAQLQQLASERTQLQAENERLKKELADLKKDRDALDSAKKAAEGRARASQAAISSSAAQRQSAEQDLEQQRARTEELVAEFRKTAQLLRDVESDRTTTKQSLATRDQELRVCADRNLALYKLNGEVLDRLEKRGAFGAAVAEPFTRLKRTQLENLIEDYRYRANEQQVEPPKDPASGN